jgi:phage FluMu protein Com
MDELEEKCPHCHRLEWARFDRSFASPDPKVKGILHYWEQFQCRHCGYLHRVPTRAED